ncbi:MAG: DUF1501 domain-containing protein [Flavipsychrobacter sp.]|nr:DUF1501 domain-containing protein [Flavipsychrobacter sp.]
MKRRDFLKATPAASLALMINGTPIGTYAQSPLLKLLAKSAAQNGRVMVIIQLSGGNDGLNTIIPLDQYAGLSTARANVMIPANQVLPLNGYAATGMHPAMTGLQTMFNNGQVNIVQGVSYPNPNLSHFRATDIWFTGSSANQYLETGWVGRYLEEEFPGFPNGYPNADMPDPLAIQIGSNVSNLLQGPNVNMGMAIADIDNFYNLINNTVSPAPNTPAGHELTFIRFIAQQTQQYTVAIQNAAASAANLGTYPANNYLANQLKIVARLVAGGLQTPVYVVGMGGFDTHSEQVDAVDHTIGAHANLLTTLSEAVSAFFNDLTLLGHANRVAATAISEFGRRIISNGSGGTDHGTGQPIMTFGPGVNPIIIGNNPTIQVGSNVSDNIPMQHDFRSIYAAILADWFQVSQQTMTNVLQQNFPILPVFAPTTVGTETVVTGMDETLGQNFPNPFTKTTTINFGTDGNGPVTIELFDVAGRKVKTVCNQTFDRGKHEITINRDGLVSGTYFYRMTKGNEHAATKQMLVVD